MWACRGRSRAIRPTVTRRETLETGTLLALGSQFGIGAITAIQEGEDEHGIAEGASLDRFATAIIGAEITGLFMTERDEFFFNVQHTGVNLDGEGESGYMVSGRTEGRGRGWGHTFADTLRETTTGTGPWTGERTGPRRSDRPRRTTGDRPSGGRRRLTARRTADPVTDDPARNGRPQRGETSDPRPAWAV